MAMPEAAMDENDRAMLGELEVGFPRQIGAVDPIAETAGEQRRAYQPFRPRIRRPYGRHHAASRLGRYGIHQGDMMTPNGRSVEGDAELAGISQWELIAGLDTAGAVLHYEEKELADDLSGFRKA